MKFSKQLLLSLFAVVFILSSCSVEKRVYNKGFHVEWNKSSKKSTEKLEAKKADKKADKIEAEIALASMEDAKAKATFNTLSERSIAVEELAVVASVNNKKSVVKAVKSLDNVVLAENLTPAEVAKIEAANVETNKAASNGMGEKSQIVALILAIFVGALGIHRFYLGYIGIGVIQLLTAGGCGIWALIDIIRIAMGDLGPNGGSYDKTF